MMGSNFGATVVIRVAKLAELIVQRERVDGPTETSLLIYSLGDIQVIQISLKKEI